MLLGEVAGGGSRCCSRVLLVCLQYGLFTTVHKHYTVEDWVAFAKAHPDCLKVLCVCGCVWVCVWVCVGVWVCGWVGGCGCSSVAV